MHFRAIFIAGCDRSGTTMLGDMLGAADGAFATPESQWVHDFLRQLHLRAFSTPGEAASWLRRHFRFAVWELPGGPATLAALIDLDEPRRSIERIILHYLRSHCPDRADNVVWIDHTPDNFKQHALLQRYFPEARYIHIVRDGRAVFHSIRRLNWGPNNAYMATRHWAERLQQALDVEIAEGHRCRRIRYEDILAQPEQTLSDLCNWSGLSYQDQMLEGGGLILPRFTQDQHKLVGQRPDTSRAADWQQKLRHQEICEFEAYAPSRQLLQTLGYPVISSKPVQLSSVQILLRYLHDQLLYFIHRRAHRNMELRHISRQSTKLGPSTPASAGG